MSVVKVETKVTGPLFNVQVFLEGVEISLNHDGDERWSSTNMVDARDGRIGVIIHVQGISNTDWSYEINEIEPDKKQLAKDGSTVRSNGHDTVTLAPEI